MSHYSRPTTWMLLALVLSLSGCSADTAQEQAGSASEKSRGTQSQLNAADAGSDPGMAEERVIDVITHDFAIEAPEQMETGWYTMRLENRGQQTHFVVMYRLAEGKTIEDQRRDVVPAFDKVMNGIRAGEVGKADIGNVLVANTPEWGLQMTYVGGVGLLAPGKTAQTSFRVPEPGTYLLECYVKSDDGSWHTSMGMLAQVDVADEGDGGVQPEAHASISIRNDGIEAPETLPAGRQTVRVDIIDRPDAFMPYDVNLARLADDSNLDEIIFWMDWSNVGGLRAPAPVDFLGGVEHMEAGNHGYITVDLSPGRYLWISEINADSMHRVFTVE